VSDEWCVFGVFVDAYLLPVVPTWRHNHDLTQGDVRAYNIIYILLFSTYTTEPMDYKREQEGPRSCTLDGRIDPVTARVWRSPAPAHVHHADETTCTWHTHTHTRVISIILYYIVHNTRYVQQPTRYMPIPACSHCVGFDQGYIFLLLLRLLSPFLLWKCEPTARPRFPLEIYFMLFTNRADVIDIMHRVYIPIRASLCLGTIVLRGTVIRVENNNIIYYILYHNNICIECGVITSFGFDKNKKTSGHRRYNIII